MAILYLSEQKGFLQDAGDRIQFCKSWRTPDGTRQIDILMEWPCAEIEHVMLLGNIQLRPGACEKLLLQGVEIALLSLNGWLYGQLTPALRKNIWLQHSQYQKSRDHEFTLNFSRTIVKHKILAAVKLLKIYKSNHPAAITLDAVQNIEKQLSHVETADSLETLRGYEGAASAGYFSLLGQLLPEEFRFKLRSRRPPKDPANAVLSFGYTVAANELQSLLDGMGFDPYLGFYHQVRYGRPSLALDIVELFRHSFIDRLMLNLFNLKILNSADFVPTKDGGIYLSPTGKQKFFEQYYRLAGDYISQVPDPKQKTGMRKIFQEQLALLVQMFKEDTPLTIADGIS